MDLFKNPSSADLDFIEELISKYKIEDHFLTYLKDEDREMVELSESTKEKRAVKSFFKGYFPYTQKLWEEIFLVINNKLPINLVAADFEKRSGLPKEICEAIAKDIVENPTIQKEIKAVRIEEDSEIAPEDFPKSEEDLREMQDEKTVADIERNIQNGGSSENESGLGLGQELLK